MSSEKHVENGSARTYALGRDESGCPPPGTCRADLRAGVVARGRDVKVDGRALREVDQKELVRLESRVLVGVTALHGPGADPHGERPARQKREDQPGAHHRDRQFGNERNLT